MKISMRVGKKKSAENVSIGKPAYGQGGKLRTGNSRRDGSEEKKKEQRTER